jgi:glucose-1-phosphate thymidylyltransferase
MLLPVGESTVIDRILSDLEADDRIERVYLSTNERFAPAFEDHLAEHDYEKATLSIEDTSAETEKFGVVGALGQLVEREGVDDDLLVVAGDNLMGFSMGDFLDFYEEKAAPSIAAYDVGSLEKAKSYGLVALDDDRVVDFQEKPEEPKSTLVSIACYAFPADAVRFREYLSGDNNPDEPGWYIQWLQSEEGVFAYSFEEPWFDIGTPDAYLEAVAWALDDETIVAADATVEDCDLGENVHVMPGAELSGVALSNSIVFHDAVIEDSDLVDSIVDEHAEVTGKTLTHSLVGSYSRLS